MRILITGGTGLIGRALCKSLVAQGHQLTVLSRSPNTVKQLCLADTVPIGALSELTPHSNFDAIINLAGEPIVDHTWSETRKKQLWDSRVTLTKELVDFISKCEPKPAVLLSGSAVGYYGDCGERLITESSGPGNDFPAELCIAWEREAQRATAFGVRVCLLRTGLVLSKQGGLLARMLLPFKLALGARLGDGKQWMSWIHIDDYVEAVRSLLADEKASGACNMTAPQPVNNKTFTAELANAVHRPAWLVAPAFLLKAALGSRAVLVLGGQKVIPERLNATGFQFIYKNLPTALQNLVEQTRN